MVSTRRGTRRPPHGRLCVTVESECGLERTRTARDHGSLLAPAVPALMGIETRLPVCERRPRKIYRVWRSPVIFAAYGRADRAVPCPGQANTTPPSPCGNPPSCERWTPRSVFRTNRFPRRRHEHVIGIPRSITMLPIAMVWSSPRCCQVAPPSVVFDTPSPSIAQIIPERRSPHVRRYPERQRTFEAATGRRWSASAMASVSVPIRHLACMSLICTARYCGCIARER